MARAKTLQIQRVFEAAQRLGELAHECVFVGGAVTALLLTDPAVADVRPTLDIDVIVEVATRRDYYSLQERLRSKGFREDLEDGVICRWRHGEIILDVMPTAPEILGFTNRWYANAILHAHNMEIEGLSIRVVGPAHFLATKLEAFHGRGEGDYMTSRDLEDCIAILDGRPEIVAEVAASADAVRDYLAEQAAALLRDDLFLDALPGHLPGDSASQRRVPLVEARLEEIAGMRE